MKLCTTCGESKPLEEMARDSSKPDGYRGRCLECQRAYWTSWRSNGNAHRTRASTRRWREANPGKVRDAARLRNYGMSREKFLELMEKQHGRCAICLIALMDAPKSEAGPRTIAVDHHHATGEVRGLLCTNCNTGLGMFRDEADTLARAIAYLTATGTAAPGMEIRTCP